MNYPVITLPNLSLRRVTITVLMAAALLLPGAVRAASDAGLRSFTAPPGNDDGRPRPDKAPRVAVERRALPPLGAEALSGPGGETRYALACSAAEAAPRGHPWHRPGVPQGTGHRYERTSTFVPGKGDNMNATDAMSVA